jgi:hypothetical protein
MFGGSTNRIINAIKSSTQNNNVIREPTPSLVKAKAVSTSTTQTRDDNEIVSDEDDVFVSPAGSGSGFANVSRTPLRVDSHSQNTTPHRSPDANPTTAPSITPAANEIITAPNITPTVNPIAYARERRLHSRRLHGQTIAYQRNLDYV